MQQLGLITLCFLFGATAMATNTSPSSIKIKILKAQVCTSGDCKTGCMTVYDGGDLGSAPYEEMAVAPELGSTDVPVGTYNCVRMEISDIIKFKPVDNVAGGACVADTEVIQDVNSAGSPSTGVLFDGTPYSGQAGEQKIAVYISTWSTSLNGTGNPPARDGDSGRGIKLSSPLVVTAATGGVFYLDGSGQVYVNTSNGNACEFEVPKFGFRAVNSAGK